MKSALNISARERWILALVPAVAIVAIYLFGFLNGLSAELSKAEKRADAALTPVTAPKGPTALDKARGARDAARRDVKDRQDQITQLDAQIAALPKNTIDYHPSASLIEQVEGVFSHNGLTPIVSESADDGAAAASAPAAILDLLAPRQNPTDPAAHRQGRIWHYVFEDKTPRFQKAVKELVEKIPSVIPVSMNLVYNPADLGQTRLLELWLLY